MSWMQVKIVRSIAKIADVRVLEFVKLIDADYVSLGSSVVSLV